MYLSSSQDPEIEALLLLHFIILQKLKIWTEGMGTSMRIAIFMVLLIGKAQSAAGTYIMLAVDNFSMMS